MRREFQYGIPPRDCVRHSVTAYHPKLWIFLWIFYRLCLPWGGAKRFPGVPDPATPVFLFYFVRVTR